MDANENRFSIGFALQHSGSGTPVPPPTDPVQPVPAPEPYPLTIPGNPDAPHTATIDASGAMTPVSPNSHDISMQHQRLPGEQAEHSDTQGLAQSHQSSLHDTSNLQDMQNQSKAVDLSKALSWIPSYLNYTAYGERFAALQNDKRSTHPISFDNPLANGYGNNNGVISSGHNNPAAVPAKTRHQEQHHHRDELFNRHLPQLYPDRQAVELDRRNEWVNTDIRNVARLFGVSDVLSSFPNLSRTLLRHELSSPPPPPLHSNSANTGSSLTYDPWALTRASSSSSSNSDDDNVSHDSRASRPSSNANNVSTSLPLRRDSGLQPLPSEWSKKESESAILISERGCRLDYLNAKNSHSASTLRTDNSIPTLCGVYYYEVEILEHVSDGVISVGFCTNSSPLSKLPGNDQASWGYHCDDGRIYVSGGPAREFGPKISVGDTIGCGLNISTGSIFYTKNGLILSRGSPAFTGVSVETSMLYPCVGLKNRESVMTNFGHDKFLFDIDNYVFEQKSKVLAEINQASPPPDIDNESEFIKDLISSYLAHVGYLEASQAFDQERQQDSNGFSKTASSDKMDVDEDNSCNAPGEDGATIEDKQTVDVINRRRIQTCVLNGDIDGAFKLLSVFYPNVLSNNRLIKFKLQCRKFIELVRHPDRVNEALEYGQNLHKEYNNDKDEIISHTLRSIFSVLAYEDPSTSREVAHLLDKEGLVPLAEQLNSAILVSQGKPAVPSLQRLAQHAMLLVWELADQDDNKANLINVKEDFLE